ncbi:site-specific DNA-methyltransferase [Rubrivivax gelatinosus]|uniref:site-specific DNA-methyltransferase (adenine-specific) n=1 Tax=Rubrivivax gelatinosus (strain NBRC 100245 / IL144) TaxID=983917 RepID=I0HPN5_RUBGI|nr:site-specific DNA-methyltransferase [Rubrivivax gelatinosus]BAL94972.1 DNA methylase N-4/N-6 domain protein [Rubrivivax gelatinosus IL144]
MATKKSAATPQSQTTDYQHAQQATQRPDVGVQDQFNTKKPPKTYRYDSSLDPALSWDENRDRDLAEWLLGLVQRCATEGEAAVFTAPQVWAGGGVQVQSLKAAADLLQALSQPFLNWAGKAERHQISVPTVPLFVHERHSTKAILEGIKHRKAKGTTYDLFGDGGGLDVTDKLDAYEHKGPWQNRMILGDSLQVMNSLLEFEGLGGQVQMIYMDPPYGVRFGSNFQPFVRKREVKHGGDADMSREPEMVKAYRDTWELGLHSYLTYLRDRLQLAKELLHDSGSIFVQISDTNLHHVREVMDEVFGQDNFLGVIAFKKATGLTSDLVPSICDFLVWYGKNKSMVKFRRLFVPQDLKEEVQGEFRYVQLEDGSHRTLTKAEKENPELIDTTRLFRTNSAVSPGVRANTTGGFEFRGLKFDSGPTRNWKTTIPGMLRLAEVGRLILQAGATRIYKQFWNDFPFVPLSNAWLDVRSEQDKLYVVQTSVEVVKRCILMATDPGDLVFDPCCGSGTTAFVAEQWGRRWITCDTSRVPLALARQRLLTATFPYYELKNHAAGPQGGFVYKRKQNRKGEESGGLVPHITLKCVANDEPPAMEVLVDRPEVNDKVTRVAGPFVVEATIAPAQTVEMNDSVQPGREVQSLDAALGDADAANGGLPLQVAEPAGRYSDPATHIERMTQVLRQSKTLRLPGNRELVLADIRRMTDSEAIHAEGLDAEGNRIAVVFGPEDGAISSDVVFEAAREAYFLKFPHLYFFGFAIQAKARELLEDRAKLRVPCTYVTVTPDVAMSDLLKTSRASEIFSVTGLPDAVARKTGKKNDDGADLYEVELRGLDIFNPATMDQEDIPAQNLPAWMLDTDYDGMCFYATQVFFPKTAAWDNLQKSLKADFDPSVWEHLAGTVSEPFPIGPKRRVAVKVIDERGNELMRVLEVKA